MNEGSTTPAKNGVSYRNISGTDCFFVIWCGENLGTAHTLEFWSLGIERGIQVYFSVALALVWRMGLVFRMERERWEDRGASDTLPHMTLAIWSQDGHMGYFGIFGIWIIGHLGNEGSSLRK